MCKVFKVLYVVWTFYSIFILYVKIFVLHSQYFENVFVYCYVILFLCCFFLFLYLSVWLILHPTIAITNLWIHEMYACTYNNNNNTYIWNSWSPSRNRCLLSPQPILCNVPAYWVTVLKWNRDTDKWEGTSQYMYSDQSTTTRTIHESRCLITTYQMQLQSLNKTTWLTWYTWNGSNTELSPDGNSGWP